jgi:hypothetical protein
MKRILVLLAAVFVLVIVACGDHVVVPADKSGKCVAGLLTKCGDTCVDLQTDLNNCGACMAACGGAKVCVQGKCQDACPPGSTRCTDKCVSTDVDRTNCGMCGKACAGNEVCAKGKCAASCEAVGYLTCMGMSGMLDAGGAMNCVDARSDQNNCGACGKTCLAVEACSNGLCCPTGQVNCGGTCLDTSADPNNCGGCGIKCPMAAPSCAFGACSKCRPTILLLGDAQTGVNTNMKNAFKAAGFNATAIDNGSTTYAGMPAASDFGVVLIARGQSINSTDMPAAGQQAIVTAQGAGTGLILDAFVSLEHNGGRLQALKPLSLMTFVGGYNGGGTVQSVLFSPWFTGIPGSFGINNVTYWNISSGPMNNGIVFANFNTGTAYNDAVYRASPNGRIVHYGYAINYSTGANQWVNDPNMSQWTINGARWAAQCLQ